MLAIRSAVDVLTNSRLYLIHRHLFGNPGIWGGGRALHDADNARLLCNFVHAAAVARRLRAHHAAHRTTAPMMVGLPVWWSHHTHAAVGSSANAFEVMTLLLGLPARRAHEVAPPPRFGS